MLSISDEHLAIIAKHTGFKHDILKDMYLGKRGYKEQLLSHSLASAPEKFYLDLEDGKKNALCNLLPCLSSTDLDKIFGKTLIGSFKKTPKYNALFNALENMPKCHIESSKISLGTYRQSLSFFFPIRPSPACAECMFKDKCEIPKKD